MNLHSIQPKLPAFRRWLAERGACTLSITNEWEVLRFSTDAGTSIIYRNAGGRLRFTGESEKAWNAYLNAKPFKCVSRKTRQPLTVKQRTVIDRDGDLCFLCGQRVERIDVSLDHLVPLAHGGPNHVSNLVLAHRKCNEESGVRSAAEKIAQHVEWKIASTARPSGAEAP